MCLAANDKSRCCHGIATVHRGRYLLVSSHPSDPVPAEAVGALAEELPTHASYSKVTGWHDAVVDSESGLDCCHQLSVMLLLLAYFARAVGCYRERLGANHGCAHHLR